MRSSPEYGSPPLTPDELLAAPLVQLLGCSLDLRCYEGCTRPAQISLQRMAAAHGARLKLRWLITRLRCSRCKRRPAEIAISDSDDNTRIPTWRVVLET